MHSHPQTFDEAIARGFPHKELAQLAKLHKERKAAGMVAGMAAATAAAPLLPMAAAAATVRQDQASMTASDQTAFQNAIVQLVSDGTYLQLIQDHMDMSHNMHGSMGEVGLYRFLAWHRRFLVEFERQLQRADATLRPDAANTLGVPYWRWQDPFPAWMDGFLPANDPDSGDAPPPRKNAPPPDKANAADIDIIVNQFQIQTTGIAGENDYTKFTYGLEGWGLRPDGTSLPAHNHGHAWIGGIMNNTSTSPTDPIFWMHHAEVDRLWEIWRQANPTPAPPLAGSDRVMDPWAESYDDLLDIGALGYGYDSMSL
ncbi:MAG TPA: tyrosinase family protein [Bryobacteraceae bacterium]|nr:tyrosinase family protein [Bryobacteraceae bacterium]